MNHARGSFPSVLGMASAAAATTWLAMWSWRGFTRDIASFLGPLLVLAVVVALSGAVARWARLATPLVVLAQLVLSGALASTMLCGSPLPVGPAWDRMVEAFTSAVASAQEYAAPVPASAPGVHPLLIAGGLVCLLLVDVLACSLRRVPLAGLPLLTVYSVPVSLLVDSVSWWVFALTAGGFLLMLHLQVGEQLARWGRPLGSEAGDPSAFSVSTGAVRTSAGTIGVGVTALAVFLPLFIPTLDLNILGGGEGDGNGDIVIQNPMTDLRRDLQRGDDIPLVRIRTQDRDPSYLRIASLNRFNDNEWSSGNRDVPSNQLAMGPMPPLQGVAGTVARTEVRYDVEVLPTFKSSWLPTQFPISQIQASGDWRYDPGTMDFLAGDAGQTTAGMDYSMTAVHLDLSAESMARAPSGGSQVDDEYLDLPGLPAVVSNLAFQVTRNAPTRLQKAQVLQDWFREDGGFSYDLNAESGNGTDDLVRFLTVGEGGRVGYCEQFASAMAVMARTLGIPSRVAVGFLQPTRLGPDTYEYSAWDMHAWPELFFPGSGWVKFEPTPPGRASGVPGYSTERVADPEDDSGPANPRASDELPDRGASDEASPSASADAGAKDDSGTSFPWLPVGGGTLAVLLLSGLLLLPRGVRRRRTAARVGAGPEPAWLELRDTALDLGIRWPANRSPRETRDHLVDHLGAPLDADTAERPAHGPEVNPDAVAALDLLVLALERLRYSRGDGAAAPALRAEVETVVESMYGGATRGNRRRATWWPRSVVSRPRRSSRRPVLAPITVRHGGVVDHVG